MCISTQSLTQFSFLQSLKFAEKNGSNEGIASPEPGPNFDYLASHKGNAMKNPSRTTNRYEYSNQASAYSDDSSDSEHRRRLSKEKKESFGHKSRVGQQYESSQPSRRLYDPDSQHRKQKSKRATNRKPKRLTSKYGLSGGDCCRVSSSGEGLRTSHLSGPADITSEYESKLKAMRLRIKGQLETIRSLETQLAESTHILTTKDAQLAEAFKRLMVLEKKEKMRLRASQDEEKHLATGNGKLRTEESKVFQLKAMSTFSDSFDINDCVYRRKWLLCKQG